MLTENLDHQQKEVLVKIQKRRNCFAKHISEEVLAHMEDLFETNLPCFQRTEDGSYNTLEAMRKDAFREVILKLRYEISLATNID